jgi:hypothetical protein
MDTPMMLMLVLAAWLVVRWAQTGRAGWLLAAGAAVGAGFELKLAEALIALPALVALAWLGSGQPRARRAEALALAGIALLVVALAWPAAVSGLPARQQPQPLGAGGHGVVAAMAGFDGAARLAAPASPHAARGGLLSSPHAHLGSWLWVELAPALVLGLAAAGLGLRRRRASRLSRAGAVAVGIWLVTGVVLFTAMPRLHTRYVEAFTPAVAATLGVGVAALGGLAGRRHGPALAAAAAVALLVAPLSTAAAIARSGIDDSARLGTLAPAQAARIEAYLRAHRGRGALASVSASKPASLIALDGRPVVVLNDVGGVPLVRLSRLRSLVRHRRVRYVLMGAGCGPRVPRTAPDCSLTARWAHAHGTDVSRAAGLGRRRVLYRVGPAAAAVVRCARKNTHAARDAERPLTGAGSAGVEPGHAWRPPRRRGAGGGAAAGGRAEVPACRRDSPCRRACARSTARGRGRSPASMATR